LEGDENKRKNANNKSSVDAIVRILVPKKGRVFERTSSESANVIASDPHKYAADTRSQKDATNDVSFLARK
jgi:hypothetical protein